MSEFVGICRNLSEFVGKSVLRDVNSGLQDLNLSFASDVTDASDASFMSAASTTSQAKKKSAKKRGARRMRAQAQDDEAREEERKRLEDEKLQLEVEKMKMESDRHRVTEREKTLSKEKKKLEDEARLRVARVFDPRPAGQPSLVRTGTQPAPFPALGHQSRCIFSARSSGEVPVLDGVQSRQPIRA